LEEPAIAFAALSGAPAARRNSPNGPFNVSFGPTAAAKALWAIRPRTLALWDDKVRDALGFSPTDGGYLGYLQLLRQGLRSTAARWRSRSGDSEPCGPPQQRAGQGARRVLLPAGRVGRVLDRTGVAERRCRPSPRTYGHARRYPELNEEQAIQLRGGGRRTERMRCACPADNG
jgi:hypothetical protein